MSRINRGPVIENSASTILDRVADSAGEYPTAASISSITIKSIDLDTGLVVKTTTITNPVTIATIIMDELLLSKGWNRDKIGWNIFLVLSGDYWPDGDRSYRVEIKFTPVDGDPFYSLWEVYSEKVHSE